MRHPPVEHVRLRDAAAHRAQAGLHLRRHPGGQLGQQHGQISGGDLADQLAGRAVRRPGRVEPLDVGEHDELLGAHRDRDRGGRGVGVDVVGLAARTGGHGGHHRDPAVVEQRPQRAGVDRDDVADQAEVDLLALHHQGPRLGRHQPAVLAGQADRERAVVVDQPDHVAVDLTHEHHPDDLHRLRGGDPQPGAELGRDAEPLEVRGDLRAAAVHDDRLEPDVAEEDHVLGEGALQRRVGHRVPAVLEHDDGAVEALQPGQRLDERGRLGQRGRAVGRGGDGHVEYAEFSWT